MKTLNPNPILVIDTREQRPLDFQNLQSKRGTLRTGDYSIAGLEEFFAIERKTIADLVTCCGGQRKRFEQELERLRDEVLRFRRLLIVGNEADIHQHRYRSRICPACVLGSLATWEVRYDLPAVWVPTPEAASVFIERWARYFLREMHAEHERFLRGVILPEGEIEAYTGATALSGQP